MPSRGARIRAVLTQQSEDRRGEAIALVGAVDVASPVLFRSSGRTSVSDDVHVNVVGSVNGGSTGRAGQRSSPAVDSGPRMADRETPTCPYRRNAKADPDLIPVVTGL